MVDIHISDRAVYMATAASSLRCTHRYWRYKKKFEQSYAKDVNNLMQAPFVDWMDTAKNVVTSDLVLDRSFAYLAKGTPGECAAQGIYMALCIVEFTEYFFQTLPKEWENLKAACRGDFDQEIDSISPSLFKDYPEMSRKLRHLAERTKQISLASAKLSYASFEMCMYTWEALESKSSYRRSESIEHIYSNATSLQKKIDRNFTSLKEEISKGEKKIIHRVYYLFLKVMGVPDKEDFNKKVVHWESLCEKIESSATEGMIEKFSRAIV